MEAKQARRAERLAAEARARRLERRQRLVRRGGYGAVGGLAAVLVTLAVVLSGTTPATAPVPPSTASGTGGDVGQKAPAFTLTDVVSGRTVTARSLRGRRTMLFFSEGVNCQACMVQAADLEKAGVLRKRGITLVSVTNDKPGDLADAARQYGITTPLLADPSTEMTARYGMLGHGGMGHPTVAGHAFLLVDEQGRVAWHQAYQEMYVKPAQLLEDLRSEVAA